MAYVGNQPARGQWRKLTDISGSFNGVTTTFTTSVPPGTSEYYVTAGSASQLLISLGGVIQQPDTDYTVSTNSITFTTAPTAGLSFFGVLCGDALNTGTPSDGSVTTAKLAGSLSVGLTGGSASTPSLYFTGDVNTGIYSPGADTIAFVEGGTEAMRIDSSGRVGIGTASPGFTLDVNGSTRLGGSTGPTFGIGTAFVTGQAEIYTASTTRLGLGTTGAADFSFYTNSVERGRWDSSGRFLVGTSTARSNFFNSTVSALHQVEGSTDTNSRISSQVYGAASAGGPIYVFAKHRSNSIGGNTVVQNGDVIGEINFQGSDGAEFVAAALISVEIDGTPGANDMPGRLIFGTTSDGASSPTERMRIASTGRFTFEVNSTTGGFYINSWSSGAGNSTVKYNTATGQLTFDSSSHLIKEDIKNCPYGIKEVKQLQPRIYKRKDSNEIEIGFISDEMREVIPELAPLGPKSGLTGNSDDTEEIPISVNYDKFTAVLTAALQETIAKIETLEAKVAALEAS